MSNINYEAEVKKVYPDAYLDVDMKRFCEYEIRVPYRMFGIFKKTKTLDRSFSELNAWKFAYNSLKQKGLIK